MGQDGHFVGYGLPFACPLLDILHRSAVLLRVRSLADLVSLYVYP